MTHSVSEPFSRSSAARHGPLPNHHPAVQDPKIGVLLVNLGTPDGTDYWSV
ncbi:MAG: ferrochelatase, partial [Henriciella sp.]